MRLQYAFACAPLKLHRRAHRPKGLSRGCTTRSPQGEAWWGRKDLNLRSHEAADLQASPVLTKSVAYGSQIRRIGPYFRAYMAKGRTPPWRPEITNPCCDS